jgi:hypothetical protein
MITHIESKGRTLEQLAANAVVSIENWHGDFVAHYRSDDLPTEDYKMIVEEIRSYLEHEAEKAYEAKREDRRLEIE